MAPIPVTRKGGRTKDLLNEKPKILVHGIYELLTMKEA